MSDTVKIKFLETATVQTGTDVNEVFEQGKTYELSPRSADRWVKRGKAEFVSDEDREKAEGASSDVNLKLSDEAKKDPNPNHGKRVHEPRPSAPAAPAVTTEYKKMNVDALKAEAEKRGLTVTADDKKGDLVALLERNDKVSAAIAAHDYDELSEDELKDLASREGIDISAATSKADIIAEIEAAHEAA